VAQEGQIAAGRLGLVSGVQRDDLKARGEDALEGRVLRRSIMQCASAGELQPLRPGALGQAEYPLRDVQPILGSVIKELLDDVGRGRANTRRLHRARLATGHQAGHFVGRQVGQDRLALTRLCGAIVGRDVLMVSGEQLDRARTSANPQQLADQPIRR